MSYSKSGTLSINLILALVIILLCASPAYAESRQTSMEFKANEVLGLDIPWDICLYPFCLNTRLLAGDTTMAELPGTATVQWPPPRLQFQGDLGLGHLKMEGGLNVTVSLDLYLDWLCDAIGICGLPPVELGIIDLVPEVGPCELYWSDETYFSPFLLNSSASATVSDNPCTVELAAVDLLDLIVAALTGIPTIPGLDAGLSLNARGEVSGTLSGSSRDRGHFLLCPRLGQRLQYLQSRGC